MAIPRKRPVIATRKLQKQGSYEEHKQVDILVSLATSSVSGTRYVTSDTTPTLARSNGLGAGPAINRTTATHAGSSGSKTTSDAATLPGSSTSTLGIILGPCDYSCAALLEVKSYIH